MNNSVLESINKKICLENELFRSQEFISFIDDVVSVISKSFSKKNKLLICGNGGSAADSQHFAAELVGRFMRERKALPAIALTTDTSVPVSYTHLDVYKRQDQDLIIRTRSFQIYLQELRT